MSRLAVLLPLLSLALATHASESSHKPGALAQGDEKLGTGVLAALERKPRIRVFVFFSVPPLQEESLAERTLRASAIRGHIISAIPSAEIDLNRSYQFVPAFLGSISRLALEHLLADANVLRIDVERFANTFLAEVVPAMGADLAHALDYTGKDTVVAVIDSGIDTDHPDLSDDLIAEACFCDLAPGGGPCCPNGQTSQFGPGSAEDDEGHGTHVTGVITSGGLVAPEGVAPDAGIVAVKYSTDTGLGFPQGTASDMIASLDWIVANRPDVDLVNISSGFAPEGGYSGECSNADAFTMALDTAVQSLRDRDVLVFAATGNDGSTSVGYAPACIEDVVSVAATYDSNLGSFNWGPCTDASTGPGVVACISNRDASTDLAAPGALVTSSAMGGSTSTGAGTSQASPAAAACASLLLEMDPGSNAASIEAALEGSPETGSDGTWTYPFVDCASVLGIRNLEVGLVAYYPFDGNAKDESGNEIDAVVGGAVLTADRAGKPNSAFLFDGVDDRISTTPRIWSFDTTATVAAWVRPDVLQTGAIVSLSHGFVEDELLLIDRANGTNKVAMANHKRYSDFRQRLSNSVLQAGQWYFLVGQLAGGGSCSDIHIFVDGVEEVGSCQNAGGGDIVDTTPRVLRIGVRSEDGWRPFAGVIDDVRIYDRVLTATEVEDLYLLPPVEETCDDDLDDDMDGDIDFDDIDCFSLTFPVTGAGPYDAPISAIFDHSMSSPYSPLDLEVIAYNGEAGDGPDSGDRCHAKSGGGDFVLDGQYVGTTADGGPAFLCYDGHPAIDYAFPTGTSILAPADGVIFEPATDPAGIYASPAAFNALAIDHGQGYESWFLHNDTNLITSGPVSAGDEIALSGGTAPQPVSPHIHYELRRFGIPVDPYGWMGPGVDPYSGEVNRRKWHPTYLPEPGFEVILVAQAILMALGRLRPAPHAGSDE